MDKQALQVLKKGNQSDTRVQLTPWADVGNRPLQEYPRPQFARESYINLNGWWDYCIDSNFNPPEVYQGRILVPFSPESILSGVGKQLSPTQYLHYRTQFSYPKSFNKGRILLHFGAVDNIAQVWVNGKNAGSHSGGYNSFSLDITNLCEDQQSNLLEITVRDPSDTSYYCTGKQCLDRHGMWYTAQSGIWQTVWIESVPAEYIANAFINIDYDNAKVVVSLQKNFDGPVTAIVYDGKKEVAKSDCTGSTLTIEMPKDFKSWSPEDPFLYKVMYISRRDKVESYFGMRKVDVRRDEKGVPRLYLNNKKYFQSGLLDQGYWSDGLYTAPSDEAMIYDIETAKKLGFNMLRKHIKVEPMRWYYHCDRLGMLVWQDMPSGGGRQHKWVTMISPFLGLRRKKDNKYRAFSRKSLKGRQLFKDQYIEMLRQLYNCVCICTWVPFNEGWGQFDALKFVKLTKQIDPTRIVDHASGWHDQGGGDILSLHIYFKPIRLPRPEQDRCTVVTEFGGYTHRDMEHCFNTGAMFSYKDFDSVEEYNKAVEQLFDKEVVPAIDKGLSGCVYVQLSDVEDEVNGLLTYDRKVLKADAEMFKRINEKLKYDR